MMTAKEIIRWLQTLNPESSVGIDDGGLTLVAPDTEAYLEVGGIPEKD